MGGWGVSRVRRVGCGAVLLPVSSVAVSSASVIWYAWVRRVGCGAVLLPVSSVAVSSASVIWYAWAARCRPRHVPSALLSSLSAHLFYISSMASARRAAPSVPLPIGAGLPSLLVCHRRQTAASASVARARRPGGRNRRPLLLQAWRRPPVCRLFSAVCALA